MTGLAYLIQPAAPEGISIKLSPDRLSVQDPSSLWLPLIYLSPSQPLIYIITTEIPI